MGTIPAATVIADASTVLQDPANVRWPVAELLEWLNDGQREITMLRPDANVLTKTVALAAGSKQALPAADNPILLIKIHRCNAAANGSQPGDVPFLCDQADLDATNPAWHYGAQTPEITDYTYDPRNPLVWWCNPPADGTKWVDMSYSCCPAIILVGNIGNAIGISDIFKTALQDYIIYRAQLKEAEYAGGTQVAEQRYQAFLRSLGFQTKAVKGQNPNTNSPPSAFQAAPSRGGPGALEGGT